MINSSRRAFITAGISRIAGRNGKEPGQAAISRRCFGYHGVVCRECGDSCEPAAITFRYLNGPTPVPVVAADRCTGCGECVAVCPVQAIDMRMTTTGREAAA